MARRNTVGSTAPLVTTVAPSAMRSAMDSAWSAARSAASAACRAALGRAARLLGGLLGRKAGHGAVPQAVGWNWVWTTAPSRVRQVALTSSSSHFTASCFVSLSISVSTKA